MWTLPGFEIVVIVTALAIGGLVKGVTGMGLPLVTVPVIAGFIGVERAVLLMVIPSFALNAYQVWLHRAEHRALPEWPRLLLAGVPGAIFGASVLYYASERFLATALAVWILAYVLLRIAHPSFSLPMSARLRWSPLVGASAGALQAATGISAPIIGPYADALGLRPSAYVFAVCTPFGAFAGSHMVIVAASGLYTADLLGQSLIAVVPAVVCIPVGVWLRRFIQPRLFDWLIRLTLLIMGGRLLYAVWLGH